MAVSALINNLSDKELKVEFLYLSKDKEPLVIPTGEKTSITSGKSNFDKPMFLSHHIGQITKDYLAS